MAIVQNPTLSLKADAAATCLVIDAQGGPVILVGHSYGGAVITEAGTNKNVAGLVYITAFAPDKGEVGHQHLIAKPLLPGQAMRRPDPAAAGQRPARPGPGQDAGRLRR